ncbi:hypothetical protein [Paeniglutamicibacter sp. NPDC091659]|uniref:hypothetical protein n=1 Tax=Paeniglutamicibacter sp. NPDC091659 TaxID=3364389 RepID=UPI00380F402D
MQSLVKTLLISLLAAFLSVGLLVGPASAAGKDTTSATVTLSTATVNPSGSVTVGGQLKKGSRAYKGVKVTVQKRISGTSKWHNVRTAKTNSAGRVSVKVTGLQKNYDFRLTFAGSRTAKASSSSRKTVKVKQQVTVAKVSATTVNAGDNITLSGTTSKALVGQEATLQAKSGKSWKNLGTAKVNSKRAFSVKGKAIGLDTTAYRVWIKGTAGVTGTASAARNVTVYAWYSLDYTPAEGYVGLTHQDYWRVAGKTYPRVIGSADSGYTWRQIMLGKKCRTFKSKIGAMDMSNGGYQRFWISARSYKEYGAGPLGTLTGISADVTGEPVFLIGTIGVPSYNTWSRDYPVYVGAQVSCTEEPGYTWGS